MAGQNREDRKYDQGAVRIAPIKVIFFREEAVLVKQALLKGCKIKKLKCLIPSSLGQSVVIQSVSLWRTFPALHYTNKPFHFNENCAMPSFACGGTAGKCSTYCLVFTQITADR